MIKKIEIFILSLTVLLFSCQEFEDDLDPKASFVLSKTTINTFEVVNLTNTGSGEFYTIYTGEEGSSYTLKDQGDEGISGNQNGDASFSYTTPGVFEVAFVVGSYAEGKVKESVSFQNITVLDTLNTILKISYSDLGSLVRVSNAATSFFDVESFPNAEDNIFVPMLNYRHFGYSDRSNVPLIPNIFVSSDAAKISIEKNQGYAKGDTVTHVNFEQRYRPLIYSVNPANGVSKDYVVSVVEVPEFNEFTLNDVASINRVHPSLNNIFFLTAPVSNAQDISSIIPTFSLFYPNETSLTYDGLPFTSNQALDFTNVVSFDFLFAQEDFEETFQASSEVHVKALELPVFESFEMEDITGTISLKTAGNPATYYIDVELSEENIPAGFTGRDWVKALKPVFTVLDSEGIETVSIDKGGEQISGTTQNDFSAYYLEYESNPGSFELDNLRKTYFVDRSFDLQEDNITYNNAFSLRTIYKVGVTIN